VRGGKLRGCGLGMGRRGAHTKTISGYGSKTKGLRRSVRAQKGQQVQARGPDQKEKQRGRKPSEKKFFHLRAGVVKTKNTGGDAGGEQKTAQRNETPFIVKQGLRWARPGA